MPLNPQILIDGFRAISDTQYSGFEGFPESIEEASQRYAEVMGQYISGLFPVTTGIPIATGRFINELSQTTLESQDGLLRFTEALTEFATMINGTLTGYTSVPPIGVVDISDFNDILGTAEEMATEFATRIDTWIRTGIATPSGGGSPINWS
jgi:hypothetical protein